MRKEGRERERRSLARGEGEGKSEKEKDKYKKQGKMEKRVRCHGKVDSSEQLS